MRVYVHVAYCGKRFPCQAISRPSGHVQSKPEEEAAQRAFAKFGLRLGVQITYVDVDAPEKYPMLLPSSFLELIDKGNHWEMISGQPTLARAEASFELFWKQYEVLFPNFSFFETARRNSIPFKRVCPVYIHGDEGTHFKKSGIMILQWQGVLGAGTSRSVNANTTDAQAVNSLGNTLRTRLLVGVMPRVPRQRNASYFLKSLINFVRVNFWSDDLATTPHHMSLCSLKAMYSTNGDVLEALFEYLVEDFHKLSTRGQLLKDHACLWLVPLGMKGDWPFLAPGI